MGKVQFVALGPNITDCRQRSFAAVECYFDGGNHGHNHGKRQQDPTHT
eukprot:CAMPEP_0113598348 /NCGR_PEP_ID=MMETSP0015_2-20120614/41530_1 /TAXON_ID=2838 /ORGANISM="Odontella" /LENGTH=47 /DNA_ID=CAMNT_0000506341 /DNA_START=51 /DNA_END=190 /DNA_ORIENTATION=- /assembly_acc=CAM_ASM_000160